MVDVRRRKKDRRQFQVEMITYRTTSTIFLPMME